MCILAIQYQSINNSPILMAANREEEYDRLSQPPKIQSGKPRVICGIDRKAGGTWFGVNQHGLVVTVANRSKVATPIDPRSRGLLCRELLESRTAREAVDYATKELARGAYCGANYLCVDGEYGAVVYGGDMIERVELTPGLHILSNGDLDDDSDPRQAFIRRQLTLQKVDSSVAFLAVASRAFARPADSEGRRGVVITGGTRGTVSSLLLSLTGRIQNSILQYAAGPPTEKKYDDCSALLRQVLSTDKSRKAMRKEEKPQSDMPQSDMPQSDMPQSDMPQSDMPQSDMPQSDVTPD
jgi:Transport and Golgi organisation 2